MKDSQLSSIEATIFVCGALLANGLAAVILSALALLCMADQWLCRRLERATPEVKG